MILEQIHRNKNYAPCLDNFAAVDVPHLKWRRREVDVKKHLNLVIF